MYRRSRRRRTRKNFKRKRFGGTLTRRVNYLAKRIQGETKFHQRDCTQIFQSLAGGAKTYSIFPLHEIAQGDTQFTRGGNLIKCKFLNIQGYTTDAGDTWAMRHYVIRDNQQISDTSIDPANIFQGVVPGSTASPLAPLLNPSVLGRYSILWKGPLVTRKKVQNGMTQEIKCQIPLRGLPIRFNGPGAGDIQRNGLYWVTLFENTSADLLSSWDEYVVARISFYDN